VARDPAAAETVWNLNRFCEDLWSDSASSVPTELATPRKMHSPSRSDSISSSPEIERSEGMLVLHLRTKAMVFYHAAVSLVNASREEDCAESPGAEKAIPAGALQLGTGGCRKTRMRVRRLLMLSIHALLALKPLAPRWRERFALTTASACEFLADTFLAQRDAVDGVIPVGDIHQAERERLFTALRYLFKCQSYLEECVEAVPFLRTASTVSRFQGRVARKTAALHQSLCKLAESTPAPAPAPEGTKCLGAALYHLHASLMAVQALPDDGQFSLFLSSLYHWMAALHAELAKLAKLPGAEDYFATQKSLYANGLDGNSNPRTVYELGSCAMTELLPNVEAHLNFSISLSLRCLRRLGELHSKETDEKKQSVWRQSLDLISRTYFELVAHFGASGRFTKALTTCNVGLQLFKASDDPLNEAKLLLWTVRLKLRGNNTWSWCPWSPLPNASDEEPLEALPQFQMTVYEQCVAHLKDVVQLLSTPKEVANATPEDLASLKAVAGRRLGYVQVRLAMSRLQAGQLPAARLQGFISEGACIEAAVALWKSDGYMPSEDEKPAMELILRALEVFDRDPDCAGLCGAVNLFATAVYTSRALAKAPAEARIEVKLAERHSDRALASASGSHPRTFAARVVKACLARHLRRGPEAARELCRAALALPATVGEEAWNFLRAELMNLLLRLLKDRKSAEEKHEIKDRTNSLLKAWDMGEERTARLGDVLQFLEGVR